MPKIRKNNYLSDKISSIISTAPELADDDDDDDLTTVQQVKSTADLSTEGQSDSGDELNLSQFRKINIELLDADDDKYSGVRVSRSQVEHDQDRAFEASDDSENEIDTGSVQDEEESDDEADDDDDDDVMRGGETESLEDSSEEESDGGSEGDQEMPSEDGDDMDDDDDDADENEEEEEEIDDEEEDDQTDPFRQVSAKVATDIEKGNAIRNQFSLWDSLLECRIKFQKCLAAANKLPQPDKVASFKQAGGEDFEEAQKACQSSVKKALNSLMDLQQECLEKNTKLFEESVGKRTLDDDDDDDDDEITSSGSDDGEEKQPSTSGFHKLNKRKKLGDLSDSIKVLHESLVPFRNETIQKWNEKTRITQMSSKDFSAFEQSTLKQIEMVLADRQRLLKRTRTKRTSYHIMGEHDEGPEAKVTKLDENAEIFDDDDFYHQLLRELLDRKTSDVTDPVQLSRQWIELQKARSKMKRPVDQKASKGRKLRYNVHQKLINFMMPIDNTSWADEAKNELFASLFGNKSV